jgi:plasmid maintenance system antidote protein VapI
MLEEGEYAVALSECGRAVARATEGLRRTEMVRVRRVRIATETFGFTLGDVAQVLDVSRARAQQLRRDAEVVAPDRAAARLRVRA